MRSRNTFKFTKTSIQDRALPTTRTRWYDETLPGLILDVLPSGRMTFRVYKWFKTKPINVTIGPYPSTTIEQARKETTKVLAQMVSGDNPNDLKKEERAKTITFGEVFEAYVEDFRAQIRSGSKRENSLNDHFKTWRNHVSSKLSAIQVKNYGLAEAKAFLAELKSKHSYAIHNKTLTLIKAMLNFAISQELLKENPFNSIKKMAEVKRERFLQRHEVQAFFESLSLESQDVQDLVSTLLFTGQRKQCVCSMEWKELDLELGIWNIPTSKMKGKRPHAVALSEITLRLLKRRLTDNKAQAPSKYVFPNPNTRSGHMTENSSKGGFWRRIVERAGLWSEDKNERLTIHDLRRTNASWQAMQGIDINSISKSLGHSDIRTTSDVYAHLDVIKLRNNADETIAAMTANQEELKVRDIEKRLFEKIRNLTYKEKLTLLEQLG